MLSGVTGMKKKQKEKEPRSPWRRCREEEDSEKEEEEEEEETSPFSLLALIHHICKQIIGAFLCLESFT